MSSGTVAVEPACPDPVEFDEIDAAIQEAIDLCKELEAAEAANSAPPPVVRSPCSKARIPLLGELIWFLRGAGRETVSPTYRALRRAEMLAFTTRACAHCDGTGFRGAVKDEAKGLDVPPPFGDCVCAYCQGRGLKAVRSSSNNKTAITARPVAHIRAGHTTQNTLESQAENLESLLRRARVIRRLEIVYQADSAAAEALCAFYAPDGTNLGAIWHLTEAGKIMLRQNSRRLPPRQFFENERNAQEAKPTARRRALFAAADEQARVLLEKGRLAWIEAGVRREAP